MVVNAARQLPFCLNYPPLALTSIYTARSVTNLHVPPHSSFDPTDPAMVNERKDTKSDSSRERSTSGLDALIDALRLADDLAFAATREFIHNEEVLSKVSHTSVMVRQLLDDVVKLKECLKKEKTMNIKLNKGGRHCGVQAGAVWVEAQGVLGSGIAEDQQHVSGKCFHISRLATLLWQD
jgi:hypothetical protein